MAAKLRPPVALKRQKEGGMNHAGARGDVRGDKNILYLDCSGGFMLAPQTVHLKRIRFIVGKLYP